MNPKTNYAALTAVLFAFAPSTGAAGEMKALLQIDCSNAPAMRTKFEKYGSKNPETISFDAQGARIWLPEGNDETGQTGFYSYVALAGDCEVIFTYRILEVQTPKTGYGCGVGLAFDLADNAGRGDLQRVIRVGNENGFAMHSGVAAKKKEADAFEPSTATAGRIGLRRVKKELIFLAADDGGELHEIKRLPFTDATIRTLRLFADKGGSSASINVLIRQVEIRAEEVTAGVVARDVRTSAWWWLLALIPVAGLLIWRRRIRRQRSEDEDV
jgi:hypothetical protein